MTDDTRLYLLGILDVMFAFSLALERRGILQRGEIIEMLDQVQHQATAQEGRSKPRTVVAELMLQAFRLPVAGEQVRAGFRVVDGGRD